MIVFEVEVLGVLRVLAGNKHLASFFVKNAFFILVEVNSDLFSWSFVI